MIKNAETPEYMHSLLIKSEVVLLPGKSHGQRSLVGYSPWGHEESDTTSLSLSRMQCRHNRWHLNKWQSLTSLWGTGLKGGC